MPGARLVLRRRADPPLGPMRGLPIGLLPAGRTGAARHCLWIAGRRTRRQSGGAGIDAEHPAERPQHPPQSRRGGYQRHHLRVGEQIPQEVVIKRHLVTVMTSQPEQPAGIVGGFRPGGGAGGAQGDGPVHFRTHARPHRSVGTQSPGADPLDDLRESRPKAA